MTAALQTVAAIPIAHQDTAITGTADRAVDEFRDQTPRGDISKRETQIILKTDKRSTVLELSREGKFDAKSNGCGREPGFLESDKLEVAVENGRCVVTHLLAGRDRRPNCSDAIFRTTETALRRS